MQDRFVIGIGWGGLLIATALIGVLDLGNHSFWYDEAATWRTVSLPFQEMIESLSQNVHPPLFFVLTKLWVTYAGDSELGFRSLSLILHLGTCVATGWLVQELASTNFTPKRVGSGGAGLVAAALWGLNPLALSVACQTRMYSLGVLLVLCAEATYWKGIRSGASRMMWVSAGILSLAVYCHNYLVLHAVVHGVSLIASRGIRLRQRIVIAILPLVCLAPWMMVLWKQASRVGQDYWIPPLTPDSLGEIAWRCWFIETDFALQNVAGFLVFGIVAIVGSSAGRAGRTLVLQSISVVALACTASVIWKPILMPRYLLPASALLSATATIGLLRGLKRWRRQQSSPLELTGPVQRAFPRYWVPSGFVLGLLVLQGLQVLGGWEQLFGRPEGDVRRAIEIMESRAHITSQVRVDSPTEYLPLKYTGRGSRLSIRLSAVGIARLSHYTGSALLSANERSGRPVAGRSSTEWHVVPWVDFATLSQNSLAPADLHVGRGPDEGIPRVLRFWRVARRWSWQKQIVVLLVRSEGHVGAKTGNSTKSPELKPRPTERSGQDI